MPPDHESPAGAPLALIAGAGRLPILVWQSARAQGRAVYPIVFDAELLGQFPDAPAVQLGIGQVGRLFDYLKSNGIAEITMAGKIHRPDFSNLMPDATGLKLLPGILAAAAKGDDALIQAVVRIFETRGVQVTAPDTIMDSLVADGGTWTTAKPSTDDLADIAKGAEIARAIGALDIGQGAVVCAGLVLAVEAAEGTDAMLGRIAELAPSVRGTAEQRRGVLVKCAKPGQERRVDLPVIGVETIIQAHQAHLAGIAVEAGGSIIIDRAATIAEADRRGLFVVAIDPAIGES